jgi:hypothetical protein
MPGQAYDPDDDVGNVKHGEEEEDEV